MRITHALAYAAAAALPLSIVAAVPGQAVVATATVNFQDCELTKDFVQVGGETSWSPSVTIDHPATAPVSSAQTIEVTLGTLPANTFAEDLPDEAEVTVILTFEDGTGDTFTFEADRPLPGFDKDAPLELGQFETDHTWFASGAYDFRPKSVSVRLFGAPDPENAPFDYGDYRYDCDQVVNPGPLSQIRIFDPNAAATIAVTPVAGKQGSVLTVRGRDFAREAIDDPGTEVSVFVGSVLAGAFDVDDIGSFNGVVRIPEFAKPGAAVVVRAVDAGESATTTVSVTVKRASLKAAKSVKSGGKLKLSGSGFKPGEKVAVKLKGGKGKGTKSFSVKIKVNPAGAFTKSVKLKKAAKGSWRATAAGPASYRSGKASFKVK